MQLRIESTKLTAELFESSDFCSLLEDHYQELAKNKNLAVLAPDVNKYLAMQDAGIVVTLLARKEDQLVGYSITFITKHLHYKHLVYAQNDVLFVDRSHRKGRVGIRLIKETEKICAEKGAKQIVWHAKPDTPLDMLMPALGYNTQDVMYSKEI